MCRPRCFVFSVVIKMVSDEYRPKYRQKNIPDMQEITQRTLRYTIRACCSRSSSSVTIWFSASVGRQKGNIVGVGSVVAMIIFIDIPSYGGDGRCRRFSSFLCLRCRLLTKNLIVRGRLPWIFEAVLVDLSHDGCE